MGQKHTCIFLDSRAGPVEVVASVVWFHPQGCLKDTAVIYDLDTLKQGVGPSLEFAEADAAFSFLPSSRVPGRQSQ